jgi:uracil-DNA glycosylase
MASTRRRQQYMNLVQDRQACRACCAHLENPSHGDNKQFDSQRIGPLTRWQGNLQSPLLVVGQDFADVTTYREVQGYPGANVPTNQRLLLFLKAAGFQIAPPHFPLADDKLFFTNAVLCLKRGKMRSPIPTECFNACSRLFLSRTLELVSPRAVATLGGRALDAVLCAFGQKRKQSIAALLESPLPLELFGETYLFPFFHPMASRSLAQQSADWERMGQWLNEV